MSKSLKIAFSPIYKYELPEGHRFPMIKYELIPEQLLYEGLIKESHFFHPKPLSQEQILTTHSKEYLQKLDTLNFTRKEVRDIGFPISKTLMERGKVIANGTLQCALFALRDGCALNIAGGTHHAYSNRGEGFCILNDIAISANILLIERKVKKILIIDLDVHQGNGTAHIFRSNTKVFTFSMHGERNYPTRKEKSDFDIGLPDNTEDGGYLDILKKILPKLINDVKPDFIFYLSGVDILKSDKLGRLAVSKTGCKARDEFVFQQCKKYEIPVAVSMGGGYSPMISDIVDAHTNTFKAAIDLYG